MKTTGCFKGRLVTVGIEYQNAGIDILGGIIHRRANEPTDWVHLGLDVEQEIVALLFGSRGTDMVLRHQVEKTRAIRPNNNVAVQVDDTLIGSRVPIQVEFF